MIFLLCACTDADNVRPHGRTPEEGKSSLGMEYGLLFFKFVHFSLKLPQNSHKCTRNNEKEIERLPNSSYHHRFHEKVAYSMHPNTYL